MGRVGLYTVVLLACHCGGEAFTVEQLVGVVPEGGGELAAEGGVTIDTTGGTTGSEATTGRERDAAVDAKHRDAAATSSNTGGIGGGTTRGSSGGSENGSTGRSTITSSGGSSGVRDAGEGDRSDAGPLWPSPNDPNNCAQPDNTCTDAWCSPYGAKSVCISRAYCACNFSQTGMSYLDVLAFCVAQCRRSGWKTVGVQGGATCSCTNDCTSFDCDAGL